MEKGLIERFPLTNLVAAVSVGIVGGELCLDLEYSEDVVAQVDMNVVGTAEGRLVEVQGTAEGAPFRRDELDELLNLALRGIDRLVKAQADVLPEVDTSR
jgi:ribonuclease PH